MKAAPFLAAGLGYGAKRLVDGLAHGENQFYLEWLPVPEASLEKLLIKAGDPNQKFEARVDDPKELENSILYTYDLTILAEYAQEAGQITLLTNYPGKEKYTLFDEGLIFFGQDNGGDNLTINLDPDTVKAAIEKFADSGKLEFLLNLQAIVKKNPLFDKTGIPKYTTYENIKKYSAFFLGALRPTGPGFDSEALRQRSPNTSARSTMLPVSPFDSLYIIGVTYPNGEREFYSPVEVAPVNRTLTG